jgi:putative transposase
MCALVNSIIRPEKVNIKRIDRLMTLMNLHACYPKPKLSIPGASTEKYPCLIRNMEFAYPNQVWATDITYIRMDKGFMYLVAILDLYSRYVLTWELNNSLDQSFCIDALKNGLSQYGVPTIFNSDQGSQFTSNDFTSVLKEHGIKISRDGYRRALDNVFVERFWRSLKYEEVYLRDYLTVKEAQIGIAKYIKHYNTKRPHQSLMDKTPESVYKQLEIVNESTNNIG